MPRFSDQQLIQILQKAGRRINRRLCLENSTDEIAVDASGCITPDSPRLQDLVLLQAECMLSSRDFVFDLNSGAAGLLARDGEQIIDTRNGTRARAEFFNSEHGPCSELDRAIKLELLKRGGGGTLGNIGYDVW